MTDPRIFVRRLVAATVVGLLVAGCSAAGADKGGGDGGVLTLRLAAAESPGRPTSQDIEHFADGVRSLSDGRLRVAVTWDIGEGERSWDQKAAQLVIDGDHQLGFVPAGAWDVLGVNSLRALQAPFVVTSDAALDAVTIDPVADQMMAGLGEVGVTGLALVPEGLRHPAGFGEPLREPADFAGALIRAPRGEVSWETLRALGADPQDLNGDEASELFHAGRVRGAETSAARGPSLQRPGVLTANITPYAKANVLVVNSDTHDGLSEDQQDVLRRAAQDTRDHLVATRQSDAEAVAAACDAGMQVVLATTAQQEAMVAATQTQRAKMAASSDTGPILKRITEIVDAAGGPAAIEACGKGVPGAPGPVDVAALDGLWRYEVTYQDGLDAGLPAPKAAAELGVQTVRMAAGAYGWSWRSREGEQSCEGTYEVLDGLVVFTDEPACGAVWEARPAAKADEITWTDVRTHLTADAVDQTVRELLHSTAWRKIEDLPAPAAFPEGTYRWEVSEDDLVATGVTSGDAYDNSGVMTMTVQDGRWLHSTVSPANPPDCGGTYVVTGSRIAFTGDVGAQCGGASGALLFSGVWADVEDGIQFTDIEPADPFLEALFGTVWTRIT